MGAQGSSHRKAAHASWAVPVLGVLVAVALKLAGIAILSDLLAFASFLTGLGCAVVALVGMRTAEGARILVPAVTGLVVSLALIAWSASNFASGYQRGKAQREGAATP